MKNCVDGANIALVLKLFMLQCFSSLSLEEFKTVKFEYEAIENKSSLNRATYAESKLTPKIDDLLRLNKNINIIMKLDTYYMGWKIFNQTRKECFLE